MIAAIVLCNKGGLKMEEVTPELERLVDMPTQHIRAEERKSAKVAQVEQALFIWHERLDRRFFRTR